MSFNLENKLALITGAASGLGLSSAELFALNGADLALADISPKVAEVAKELKSKYPKQSISAHVYDLTNSSNVERMFEEIKQHHPKYQHPSVLVNSAGIGREVPLIQMTEDEYDQMININLKGTFLVTQALVKRLVANFGKVKFSSPTESYASIIQFSSAASYGLAGASHYSITKAGVDGFAKSIAKEYGPQRIRCNSIKPFFIDTPMVVMTPEKRALCESMTALGRFGKPEEIAQLIYFLATDASSYITGAAIDINGGF